MNREMIPTKDGSLTIAVPGMNVTYHSVYGAIRESEHVYIGAGFYATARLHLPDPLRILEIGLGTGLNALLSLIEVENKNRHTLYTAVEPFPLTKEEIAELNYCEILNRTDLKPVMDSLHTCEWDKEVSITPLFAISKIKKSLLHFNTDKKQHLIYFDAFAPAAQPELWTSAVFEKMYNILIPGGVLVTYCCKGEVTRTMKKAGFTIEKLPGPPGKREMIRATK